MMKPLVPIAIAGLLVSSSHATSFEYYRSVFCDAQSPNFFLDSYTPQVSLSQDNLCHQTPAKTMAMKVVGNLEPECVVLAYDDYICSSLVGSLPSGNCVAATKARIGSWQITCNASETEATGLDVVVELRQRGQRLPRTRREANDTGSNGNATATAMPIASQISASVTALDVQSTSDAGASLSSAIVPGGTLVHGTNVSMATGTPSATVTYHGTTQNGSVVMSTGLSGAERGREWGLGATVFMAAVGMALL